MQIKLDTYATAASHVAAGKLRALAYAGKTRLALMPDVPTVAELGLPGYEGVLWMGLLAPARTPPPVIEKLAAAASARFQRLLELAASAAATASIRSAAARRSSPR